MKRLRQWLARLTTSMTRTHDEQRMREEVEDHVTFETEEQLRRGIARDEARRRALVEFGSVEAFKESYRDQQGVPAIEHLLQDVRISVRRLRKTPGFTVAAIATMALGLGLTSAVMGLAYALFKRPLPVQDPARLVFVDSTRPNRPITSGFGFSYPDYLYYREHARSFSDLAAHYSTSPMTVVTPGGPIGVSGAVVSGNYFELLRLSPAAGRFFASIEDQVPGRNPVVVLSYRFWQTRFAAAPQVLNSAVRINGTDFTVIGIAPAQFSGVLSGLAPNDVWIPAAMFGVGYRYCDALSRNCAMVGLVGRLNAGASVDAAQAELTTFARQLEAAYPDTNQGVGVWVRPATGIRIEDQATNAPIVGLLASAAALVLLVAAANVAGLLLARGLRRRKEIAIRLAIGAGRGRLIRLLLVESVLLSLAGGVAGLAVAKWATEFLRGFFGNNPLGSTNIDLSLDWRVALIGFGIALLTGVLTGIMPAIQSTRSGTADVIKEEGAGAGTRRSLARETLIVVQVALSVVLLGASGLLVRSFLQLHRGPGFDPDTIAILRLRPSLIDRTNDQAWAFQREAIRRLESVPGVIAASPAVVAPLPKWGRPTRPMRLPEDSTDDDHAFQTSTTFIGGRYFKTLGVNVIAGREFDDRDTTDGPRVVLLNETLARRFWPRGSAIGASVLIGSQQYEVVGVVKDLQWLTSLDQPEPIAYLNFWQQDRSNRWSQDARVHVRVSGDAATKLAELQSAVAAIDPDVPISEAESLGVRLNYQFASVRAARAMLVTFGLLTLVLSMIGLYAALAFAVAQRMREIAVRMALGASRADVGRLVFRRGLAIVSLGIVIGLIACAGAGPFLAHLLYGVSPRDRVTVAVGPMILAAIAMLAIALPAWRASRQNPIQALRGD